MIRARLERTREEIQLLPNYDYVVYNQPDGVEDCADDIRAIVRAEKSSLRRHREAIKEYFEA